MNKTQVYFLIAEVRSGREDLSDEERPGRRLDIGLDEVLAHGLEADPHMMAHKIADSLGISSRKQ
jgi:hypothetical protein